MKSARSVPTLADYPAEPSPTSRHGGVREGTRRSRAGEGAWPLVSVVTIVRNGAATLARTIESVLGQDYPAIEYLVVDGGSTDRTLDVIRHYERRIAVWLSEPDAGISDAFNKGIALARGEIIGILNSDDWYEPGAIRTAVHALADSGADIIYGKLQYWEGNRKTCLVAGNANLLNKGMTVGHPAVLVHRRCYERLGLFRLDFRQAMDYEWLLRARVSGARFCYVDSCLANMQSGGLGDRRWRESLREVARARAIHLPSARHRAGYLAYVGWAITKGVARRWIEAVGLGLLRRWYHRYMSPVSVTTAKKRDG